MLTEPPKGLAKFVTDNVLLVAVSVENGFVESLSRSLWFEGPWWFQRAIRMLRYLTLGHQFGSWCWMSSQVPSMALGVWNRLRCVTTIRKPALSHLPSSKGARPSAVSAPASDADDNQCLSHMASMSMDTGLTPLPHRECDEPYFSEVRLLMPDLMASHLPATYDMAVIQLCIAHGDVYSKLSGSQMRGEINCPKAGQSDSKGQFFCHQHLAKSLFPAKAPPRGSSNLRAVMIFLPLIPGVWSNSPTRR